MSKAGESAELSKTDRMELRRVVKGRFELVREQMEGRAGEIRTLIKKQISEDFQKPIKEAEKKSASLKVRLMKLGQEIKSLEDEMTERGVSSSRWNNDAVSGMESYISEYLTDWKPKGLQDKVNEKFEELKATHGTANLNLRAEELKLLEDLSTDALESTEAKKFMEGIPVVDTFMPLPSGSELKQISA